MKKSSSSAKLKRLGETASLIKKNISDWTMGEFLLGIRYMHMEKEKRDFSDFDKTALKLTQELIEQLQYYENHCRICNYIDVRSKQEFMDVSGVSEDQIVEYDVIATVERNGFVLMLDHDKKEVVLYINGTQNMNDVITDLNSQAVEFIDLDRETTSFCHNGMIEWARYFRDNKKEAIEELLQKHEGYQLRICGHSLGSAVSALLGFLLRPMFPTLKVICFATPKCISKNLIEESKDFCTTFVQMDDFVPLLSNATIQKLRHRVKQSNWKHLAYKDVSSSEHFKRIMKIAPAKWKRYWDQLGESTCKKKTTEEIRKDYEHYLKMQKTSSTKQKIDLLYQHGRNRSKSGPSRLRIKPIVFNSGSSGSPAKTPVSMNKSPTEEDDGDTEDFVVVSDPEVMKLAQPKPQVFDKGEVELYNPGKIFYIRFFEAEQTKQVKWVIRDEDHHSPFLSNLEFNRNYVSDHFCGSYLNAIRSIIQSWKTQHHFEKKKSAHKKFLNLMTEDF